MTILYGLGKMSRIFYIDGDPLVVETRIPPFKHSVLRKVRGSPSGHTLSPVCR